MYPPCLTWFGSGWVPLLLPLSNDLLVKPQLSLASVWPCSLPLPLQAQGGDNCHHDWSPGTLPSFIGSLKSPHSFVNSPFLRYPFDVPSDFQQNPD